jgi:Fe2+ or Zn2+ uptake regulation protein
MTPDPVCDGHATLRTERSIRTIDPMKNDESALRLPPNYRTILDIVREQGRGHHATTGDIFSEAKRRKPGIGYSTVYRALDRLRQLGLVSEVRIPGAASVLYEPAGTSHVHFVCDGCGRVDDIDHPPSPSEITRIVEGRGMQVTGVLLTLHGLCADCKVSGEAAEA